MQNPDDEQAEKDETSDLYEHIKDSSSHYDTQMMDTASEEQQAMPNEMEEEDDAMETDEEVAPLDDTKEEKDVSSTVWMLWCLKYSQCMIGF